MGNMIESMEIGIHILVPVLTATAELIGVLVVLGALVRSIHHYILTNVFKKKKYNFLLELGSGLSAALQFLMVAEVLKTVTVHSIDGIVEIAALFILRAMMSLLLHFEASEHAHSHKHSHRKAAPAEEAAPAAREQPVEEEDDEDEEAEEAEETEEAKEAVVG